MLKLGKKINFRLIFWILFYFFVFGLLLRNSFSYLDPDFGWHLKVGEEIALSGSVPRLNHYNYTYTENWVDHEWLVNLISYEIFDIFGYIGLSIFFALVIILSLGLLNIYCRRYLVRTSELVIMIVQLFGLVACLPHFGIRMQEFSFLFLLLELWIITEFSDNGKWKFLLFLLPLFYLWSNMHGSFLLGLGLLIIWPLVKVAEKYLNSTRIRNIFLTSRILGLIDYKQYILITISVILITLLTPYGFELYSFLGAYSNTFYLNIIQEWLPQFNFPYDYWQLLYLVMLVMIFVADLYLVFFKKSRKADIWNIVIIFIFLFLSFQSRRNFPLLFIVSFLYIVKNIYLFFDLKEIKASKIPVVLKFFVLACLLCGGVFQLYSVKMTSEPFISYCQKYPCAAVNFLQSQPKLKDFNILNEYNWGGYLIWQYPDKKLFIDGRLPQAEFAGHTYLEEYLEFYKKDADLGAKLKEYEIKLVLIKTKDDQIIAKKWEKILFWIKDKDLIIPNNLRNYLNSSSDWRLTYQDELASVYEKETQ